MLNNLANNFSELQKNSYSIYGALGSVQNMGKISKKHEININTTARK